MKKIVLFSILALSICKMNAQTADSVSMGSGSPSYPYDVFYNLSNHQKDTVNNSNWHLAFALRPAMPPNNTMQSATIRVNETRGVVLYKTPFTAANWKTVTDTSGLSTWPVLHNNTRTWDVGAFNADKDTTNPFDYGWGQYDMNSHNVLSNKLYVISVTAGVTKTYKKVWIQAIVFDSSWLFTIANIDGTDSVTQLINKDIFNKKLFAYYNATTKTVIDREPNHPWDLVFTYYKEMATFAPYPPAYYSFVGVLTAPQLQVARVLGVPKATSDTSNATFYSRDMNVIGWDWKTIYLGPPPSGPYGLTDSLSYFIKRDHDSAEVFKLYFTMFNNTPVNNIVFNTEIIATHVGITPVASSIGLLTVYPNPASEVLNISIRQPNTNQCSVKLIDITGKTIQSADYKLLNTENEFSFNVSDIQRGIYFISIESPLGVEVRKVLVN